MFNRPALYFIFSPSRTHPSSFFSLFPPTHTHTHTLPKHSFIPLHFLSLRERDGPELPVIPAHLAWNILTRGAVAEWRRESCCDSLLNVSESAGWQPFELKHFNDAFVLPGRGSGGKRMRTRSRATFRSYGKSRFDATRPPRIISDRSSVSRAFISASWKWSLWLLFFGPLPSIPPLFRWLCSFGERPLVCDVVQKFQFHTMFSRIEPSYSTRTLCQPL